MSETTQDPTATAAQVAFKESNEDRKRDKKRREIQRAHEYRVQTWAKMLLKIKGAQAELTVLGGDIVELFEPDFNDDAAVAHYASMTLSK